MKLVGKIYIILVSVLCFMHYPLALIAPYGSDLISHVFYFEFPHLFTASILSACYVIINIQSLNVNSRYIQISAVGLLFVLMSAMINSSRSYEVLQTLSFVFIPLGCAIALREKQNKVILGWAAGILFTVNLLFCIIFSNIIGLSGNQNWLSATLVGSFPFIVFILKKYVHSLEGFYSAAALISLVLAYILFKTETRSVLPAIFFCGLIFIWHRYSLKKALAAAGVLLLLGIAAISIKKDAVERAVNRDVRVPVSVDTVSMTLASPVFGHGPGHFQRDFPRYASNEFKMREYYTSISEHPHNEFLHISSTSGVIAAICWLVMILMLLRKNEDELASCAVYSAAALFVMGFLDKPLMVSPSALIFPLALGACIPAAVFRQEEQVSDKSLLRYVQAAIILMMLIVLVNNSIKKIPSAWYSYKGEVYQDIFRKEPSNENLLKMMSAYSQSSDADPSNVKAAYTAASIGLQYFKDINVGKKYLERLLDLEPDYADSNYKKTVYYEKLGAILGEKDRMTYLAEAEKSCLKSVDLSPWDIDRTRRMAAFYGRNGYYDKCAEWIVKVRDLVREKVRIRYRGTEYYDLSGDIKKWRESALKEEIYTRPASFRYSQANDYLFSPYFTGTSISIFPLQSFSKADAKFWKECISLSESAASLDSIFSLLLEVKSVEGLPLTWPLSTMQDKQGNALAVSSLACALNNIAGNRSALLRENGQVVCLLFDENNKPYFWNCRTGVRIQAAVEAFHKSKEIQNQLGIDGEKAEYSIFAYPHALCIRNQVISAAVSIDESIPDFSESPSLQLIKVRELIGGRPVGLLVEFRTLLESELNSQK